MKYKYSIAQIEEKIKTETRNFTPSFLDKLNTDYVYVEPAKHRKISLFKLIFTICLLLVAGTTGGVVYTSASEYETVTVDVNSSNTSTSSASIELVLNKYNKVIKTNYNEDISYSFNPLSLKNKNISEALSIIASCLEENEYLDKDNDYNFVVISSYNNKKNNKSPSCDNYLDYFNLGIDDKTMTYYGFTNVVDDDIYQICNEQNITFGQYKMMDLIMEDSHHDPYEQYIDDYDYFYNDEDYDYYSMGELGHMYYDDYYSHHGNHDFDHGHKWGHEPRF